MTTFDFKKWNNITGWLAFSIALITYTLTVEPTMSFWDCGEYIATAAKLEVGHPPGAPLFQMLGAFFGMFATSKETVALMVNMMSVFSSAFTILFMFWSSTILLKKIISSYTEINKENSIVILGSSFIGALVFTFSDSFWFNAVEAEVYAMAMLFIALMFWLGLRWEQEMHEPRGNRWLLLISLVVGLSFGVHFMALLTIPSIGFLYFFKNYKKVTVTNFILANIIIVAVLLFIFKLLLPYTLAFFGKTEIFMVNNLGLPFNSGTIFALVVIIAFFYFGLKYTKKNNLFLESIFKNPYSYIGSGRISRTEYIISLILFTLYILFINSNFSEIGFFPKILIRLPIIFFIFQTSKRLHDLGKSGFYQFIPVYNLYLIFWSLIFDKGNIGSNEYGNDPLMIENKEIKFGINYNTILLCILFVLIGFSTWMMLPIRANANTPINENKPSDAAEVLAYYNREQYGVNPLFYGPQYTDEFAGLDPDTPYLDKAPNYERDDKSGKYVIVNDYKNAEQNTDNAHKAFLPRMWSTDNVQGYINFRGVPKFTIKPDYTEEKELTDVVAEFRQAYASGKIDDDGYVSFLKAYGEYLDVEKPSTWDNLSFMVEYQFGYMYGRYLLWNFVGRQNDNQGRYDNLDGNWLSGIKAIDKIHLGSQDNLSPDVANNKGRNLYYFIPFFLGLIGLMYHAQRDLKSFYVLLALFLFTGLALKIYLNERPFEPRERDYALVGSFYVFAIWIGFGVYAIYEMIKEKVASKIVGPIVIASCLLAAPVLMATQNWDDHDRSGRYTAIAMAKNYLSSCDQNGILFTIGDNDTFPLWYAQEIEGYRTDVKIVNTSLLMTDWYIDQMKMKTYESDGLPISFNHQQYVADNRDAIIFNKQTENRWNLKDFLNFAKSEEERTKVEMQSGHKLHFFPTNKIRIPIDKNAIIANKIVNPAQNDSIVPYIDIDLKGGALYKNRLIMFDILNNNNWKRPIYFSPGSFGDDDYLWMKDYLQMDGMVYKLVPIKTKVNEDDYPDMGQMDTEKMYDLVMKWEWGNGESTKIYHDPETRRNAISYRTNISRLMKQLIAEGKNDKARKVIDLALAKMPLDYYGYYLTVEPFATGYYEIGEKQKARDLITKLMTKYKEELKYYSTFSSTDQTYMGTDIVTAIERYRSLLEVMKKQGDIEFYNKSRGEFNSYNNRFPRFGRDNE